MTERSAHWGADPLGAPTTHKGRREDCPAPECAPEQDTWKARAEQAEAAIERVRAIPESPQQWDPPDAVDRAYIRGWESVIDAIDRALEHIDGECQTDAAAEAPAVAAETTPNP